MNGWVKEFRGLGSGVYGTLQPFKHFMASPALSRIAMTVGSVIQYRCTSRQRVHGPEGAGQTARWGGR